MYQKMLNVGGGGSGASSADKVSYDNTISGLESDNVQDAIDEVNSNLENVETEMLRIEQVYIQASDLLTTTVPASGDALILDHYSMAKHLPNLKEIKGVFHSFSSATTIPSNLQIQNKTQLYLALHNTSTVSQSLSPNGVVVTCLYV